MNLLKTDRWVELDLEQGSQEWLDFRKKHIGASDAPIIMGESPWKTPLQLWEEKTGLTQPEPMNPAMARGHELEPVARAAYIDYTGISVRPAVIVSTIHHWMAASLDGISNYMQTVVEIKCPGQKDHDLALNDEVPEKYYAQLQHQMAVAALDKLDYYSYRDGSEALVVVKRDPEYISNLIEKERDFWDDIQKLTPPALCDRDYVERFDKKWSNAAIEWKLATGDLKRAEKKHEDCRETLIELSENKRCKGAGIKTQRITRKGAVEYKKIPELQDVNLEAYRKPSSEIWRIA